MKDLQKKKSIFKKWWFYVGIIVILGAFGAIQDFLDDGKINSNSKTASTEVKKETKPKKTEDKMNPEELLTKEINNKLGKKTNEGKKTIVEIESGEYTKVVINGDQTLSNKDMKSNMLRETTKIFPVIFKDDNVQKAMVTVKTTFVDKYGKESDDDGVRVLLTRETNDKIVWKNFDVNNYQDIAENLYVHPAISQASNE